MRHQESLKLAARSTLALALCLVTAVGCGFAMSELSISEPPPVGSMDNATVAVPMDAGSKPVTFLSSSLDDTAVAALQQLHPNLTILTGLSEEEAIARAAEIHGVDWRYCNSEFLQAAPNLRWVQAASAGVERYLRIPELRENDDIVFTNMQGVHGPTIADHVMAMLLHLTRDLGFYADPANRGEWNRAGSGSDRIALEDRTMFVVGLGGIGREVARRAKGFGMHVVATRRSDAATPLHRRLLMSRGSRPISIDS